MGLYPGIYATNEYPVVFNIKFTSDCFVFKWHGRYDFTSDST